MHGLDRLQAPVEFVELGVGNDRRVLLVVREAVLADLFDQVFVFLAHCAGGDFFLPCTCRGGVLRFRVCCRVPCAHRPILP